jgi:hypothetical protein
MELNGGHAPLFFWAERPEGWNVRAHWRDPSKVRLLYKPSPIANDYQPIGFWPGSAPGIGGHENPNRRLPWSVSRVFRWFSQRLPPPQ